MSKSRMKLICVVFILLFIRCSCLMNSENLDDFIFNGQLCKDFSYAVVKPDKTVWTWGFNGAGTLGNGTTESSDVPSMIQNFGKIISLDMSLGIALAADIDGNIWLWGNHTIYLEQPGMDTIVVRPKKVSYLKDVRSLNIVHRFVHLLRDDGTVWRIELDHNSPTKWLEPKKIEDLNNVKQISEYLVVKNNGEVVELEESESPELGGLPGPIYDVKQIQNVVNRFSVILKDDGTVWAWGSNTAGELGNGTTVGSSVPVQVHNLTDIIEISTNYSWNLALKADSTLWFWGYTHQENGIIYGCYEPIQIEGLGSIDLFFADGNSIVRKTDDTYWIVNVKDKISSQIIL